MNHCHICYSLDVEFICDRCDEYYCEDCSYSFTQHYQYHGSRCHFCSDQRRKIDLTKEKIRENKIKLIIHN